jgi:hypothetical protein
MIKEKIGLITGLIVILLVIITLALYFMNAGTLDLTGLASVALIIILVSAAIYVIWDRATNIRKGLPAKDERLVLTSYKAGYFGFIAAIWTAVVAPVLADILFDHELEGHYVTAAVVLVSAIVFMISYLLIARKGNRP